MLPGSSLNRNGTSISWLLWNGGPDLWVGALHRLPIAEIPGLQFFNNDAIYDSKLAVSRLGAGGQAGGYCHLFESRFESQALFAVMVHEDDDPMVGGYLMGIPFQARGQTFQELVFILKGVNGELRIAQQLR